jgi:hypothetical protein|tara:strand:+ start:548 stop:919 length:372 start_codon:yes stop_codon:yes gene_type:complete
MDKEQTETLQEMSNRFHKERETAFNKAKENITFQLRGDNKYYYAFQCAKFEHNIIKYGYDTYANKSSVRKEGLLFNEYSITLGHYYGHDLKRFNDRKEMLGFVIGYNECIATLEYNTQLKKVA